MCLEAYEQLTRVGHDDACAILFAAYHPQLELLGISTVYGNAPLDKTTNNALAVLEAIGKADIPVFPGAKNPFCRTLHTAPDIHGESGLDGTDLLPKPVRKALSHCSAIREMRDSLLSCPRNTAWLVTTGTLTNAALLFAAFPEVAPHIKGLSIMGGAIGDGFTDVTMGPPFTDESGQVRSRIGNWSPFAEFNVWCDPEASRSILQHPVLQSKTVLIPLDVTHQAYATRGIQDLLLRGKAGQIKDPSRLRRMYNELLMFFASTYAEMFDLQEGPPLHDPLAVAALLADHADPLVRIDYDDGSRERWDVDVVCDGQEFGRTVAKPSRQGTMVPRSLDLEKFWTELEKCMARADVATGYGK